jgi:hypothetical protein
MSRLPKITKFQLFVRKVLSIFEPKFKLIEYDYTGSCHHGMVCNFREDGIISRCDARDHVKQILDNLQIEYVFTRFEKMVLTHKSVDHFLSVYPDSMVGNEIKNANWLYRLALKFGSSYVYGYKYYLYFKTHEEKTAFQIVA